MNRISALVVLSVLFVAALLFPLQAQTPADPLTQALITAGIDPAVAPHAAAVIQGGILNGNLLKTRMDMLANQQTVDEQKEAADVAALQTGVANALAVAMAKDTTALPPSTGTIAINLPACSMASAWNANPTQGPMQTSPDPSYGCKAGYLQPGEKLFYTTYIPVAGLYNFSASVASQNTTGIFHLEIAGKSIFPRVAVPSTGSWSTYQTLTPGQVQLPGGIVTIVFVNDGAVNAFDLLWLGFTK